MIVLFLIVSILTWSLNYAQNCSGCGQQNILDNYCAADLTVAIDFTSAMQGSANVFKEVAFVAQNFTNLLPISQDYVNTAVIGYGFEALFVSNIFYNYYNVCNIIQTACGAYVKDGPSSYALSDLFRFYNVFQGSFRRAGIPTKFVVFTATNDKASIDAALPFAQNITASGTDIIIVGINQQNQTYLSELTPNVYYVDFNSFNIGLTNFLFNKTCTFDLTTAAPPTTLATTANPVSDQIGTECSHDVPKLWLDIIVAIDHSVSIGKGVGLIASQLFAVFNSMNIAQSGSPQFSRVALIYFDTQATIVSNLTKYNSSDDLITDLITLININPGTVQNLNITNVLVKAYNMNQQEPRNARPVVLLFTSTFNKQDNPYDIATSMKDQGWFIIGVDYNDVGDLAVDMLKNISSPGMFFKITDKYGNLTYQDEIVNAFTFANCICPPNTQQLFIVNNTSGYGHYYADCLVETKGGTYAQVAELACKGQYNGVLVSVTSQEKKAFLINNVVPALSGSPYFHIGLHNLNGARNWYGYNGTNSPLGSFQDWTPGFSANSTGDCVFYDQYDGRNWGWTTEQCMGVNPYPYICQFHACDADNYCDLSSSDFMKKKELLS